MNCWAWTPLLKMKTEKEKKSNHSKRKFQSSKRKDFRKTERNRSVIFVPRREVQPNHGYGSMLVSTFPSCHNHPYILSPDQRGARSDLKAVTHGAWRHRWQPSPRSSPESAGGGQKAWGHSHDQGTHRPLLLQLWRMIWLSGTVRNRVQVLG
jgi:hypothetical protein